MFSYSLAKNIYYCGWKAGESDIVHMISNEVSHALNKRIFLYWNIVEDNNMTSLQNNQ